MAGSLETHVASIDDSLIDGMSFGGVFAPNALRIMRFQINDNDGSWLDGSTLRLAFVLNNAGPVGTFIVPGTNSPASLFRRLRVLCGGGVECFDLQEYGRCHQMFSNMIPAQRRAEDAIEGWGRFMGC